MLFMLNIFLLGSGLVVDALQQRATCPDYALVVARGTGEPQGPSKGFEGVGTPGMANQTLLAVPNGIEYDVVYPADASATSEGIGRDDAVRYINSAHEACPEQKFALLGYSQGATVALETLETLQSTDIIQAVVFLGNPYQKANQISTVDQNGGNSTRANNGIFYAMNKTVALSDQLANSGKVLNICYDGDPVCNGAIDVVTSGNHLLYPFTKSVQTMGTKLLLSKLQ